MATTTKEMTEGAPLPLILNFTFPLLLGNILQQTYSLVDAAIVGKFLGINDLAAIGASTSVLVSAMDVVEVSAFLWRRSSERGITVQCVVMYRSVYNWQP